MNNRFRLDIWSWLSFITVIIGVLAWVWTFVMPEPYGLDEGLPPWFLTIIFNPVGAVFGIVAMVKKQRLALLWTILNLLLAVSLFPMWFLGTLLYGP